MNKDTFDRIDEYWQKVLVANREFRIQMNLVRNGYLFNKETGMWEQGNDLHETHKQSTNQ
jgi:flagellar biosynthesis/type III secretory pathway chaperone